MGKRAGAVGRRGQTAVSATAGHVVRCHSREPLAPSYWHCDVTKWPAKTTNQKEHLNFKPPPE